MTKSLYFFSFFLHNVPFVLALLVGLVLFRFMHLRSIPWLGIHYALAFAVGSLTSWMMHRVLPLQDNLSLAAAPIIVQRAFLATLLLEDAAEFIAVVLVLAEILNLAARVQPDLPPSLIKTAVKVRSNLWLLGSGMVIFGIVSSLPVYFLWRSS
ncbi:MAG: hypothetical protein ACR2HH_04040 [Chthoniobacterales bacterium]